MTLAALALSAAVAMLAPIQAFAGPATDATIISQDLTIEAGQSGGFAVPCPVGQRAIGGGIDFAQYQGYVIASHPLDQGGTIVGTDTGEVPRFWFSSAYNGDTNPRPVVFYAICSATSDATVVAHDFGVVAGSTSSTRIDCPSFQRAIGGGVGTTAGLANGANTNPKLQEGGPLTGTNTPTGDGEVATSWRANVANSTGADREFVSFAICSTDSRAVVRATDEAGDLLNPQRDCLANELALAGGDMPLGADSYSVRASAPIAAGASPVGWRFYRDHTSAIPSQRVSAICEPPPPGSAAAPPPGSAAAGTLTGQRDAALKKCKKKRSKKARKKCRQRAHLLPV